MSRRTFTETIINLAIESCLVCGIPDILTPAQVDGMSEDRLKELATESEDMTARREILEEEIGILREGLAQCRAKRPRPVTGEKDSVILACEANERIVLPSSKAKPAKIEPVTSRLLV